MWERETFDTEFDMQDMNSLTLGNDEDDLHIYARCLELDHNYFSGT